MTEEMSNLNLVCECGFKFSGAGEYRNCAAFITNEGQSGVVCPKCNNAFVEGRFVGKYKEIIKIRRFFKKETPK